MCNMINQRTNIHHQRCQGLVKWSSILDAQCYDYYQSNLGSFEHVKNISFLNPHNENITNPGMS